jgi:hypothetical protein
MLSAGDAQTMDLGTRKRLCDEAEALFYAARDTHTDVLAARLAEAP